MSSNKKNTILKTNPVLSTRKDSSKGQSARVNTPKLTPEFKRILELPYVKTVNLSYGKADAFSFSVTYFPDLLKDQSSMDIGQEKTVDYSVFEHIRSNYDQECQYKNDIKIMNKNAQDRGLLSLIRKYGLKLDSIKSLKEYELAIEAIEDPDHLDFLRLNDYQLRGKLGLNYRTVLSDESKKLSEAQSRELDRVRELAKQRYPTLKKYASLTSFCEAEDDNPDEDLVGKDPILLAPQVRKQISNTDLSVKADYANTAIFAPSIPFDKEGSNSKSNDEGKAQKGVNKQGLSKVKFSKPETSEFIYDENEDKNEVIRRLAMSFKDLQLSLAKRDPAEAGKKWKEPSTSKSKSKKPRSRSRQESSDRESDRSGSSDRRSSSSAPSKKKKSAWKPPNSK